MESPAPRRGITVFVLGETSPNAVETLRGRFEVDQRSAGLAPEASLGSSQSALRAAVNAAAWDWVLLLRGGEMIPEPLAREIEAATADPARAWGFRLRAVATYGAEPLRLRETTGSEIRLFHRRHVRFDLRDQRKEMNVEGAVVRMTNPLARSGWADSNEHRAFLRMNAVPHSLLRRVLLFLRGAVRHRALLSGATLRYLWVEAGWDRGRDRRTGREGTV